MSDMFIRTPEGVTDYLPRECAVKKEIESRIGTVFLKYGYNFIETPTFEYAETFDGSSDAGLMYKFIDRDGAVLSLRPDITPQAARAAAAHYGNDGVPIRFCYITNAFRYNENYQGKLREFTQAGVELIGIKSDDADAEVVAVAINALLAAGLTNIRVDIGQVEFLKSVIAEAALSDAESKIIMDHILKRDFASVERFVADRRMPSGIKDILSNLCYCIGGREALTRCSALTDTGRAAEAIAQIDDIYRILAGYGLGQFVSFDLSMQGMLDYYTGVIFRVYTRGTGFSVIDGGRYDKLCAAFGKRLPAVGCAIRINNITAAMEYNQTAIPAAKADTLVVYTAAGRDAALHTADELRNCGLYIENSLIGGDLDVNIRYAESKNMNGLIFFEDAEHILMVDLKENKRTSLTGAELLRQAAGV